MILTGEEIIRELRNQQISIDPFNEKNITTNSYDFHLGSSIKIYKNKILDSKLPQAFETLTIPENGLTLVPDKIYLGHTKEIIGSNAYVPIIRGRSSTGRMGIFVHITADLIDIGYFGQCTLMLHVVQPVVIYPNMKIGQVTFWTPHGEIELYDGKYKNSEGPQVSQVYKDFRHE